MPTLRRSTAKLSTLYYTLADIKELVASDAMKRLERQDLPHEVRVPEDCDYSPNFEIEAYWCDPE